MERIFLLAIVACIVVAMSWITPSLLGCVEGAFQMTMDPPVLQEGAVKTEVHIPTTMPAVNIPSGMIVLNLTFEQGAFQVPVGNTWNIGQWWWVMPIGLLIWLIPSPFSRLSDWVRRIVARLRKKKN